MNTLLLIWVLGVHGALAFLCFVCFKQKKTLRLQKAFLNGYMESYKPRNIQVPLIIGGALLGGFLLSSLLNDKREFKEIDPLPPIKEGENE